jgi:hypothetical protein
MPEGPQRVVVANTICRSIVELRGLGKEILQDIDAC